jgi:pimeloyl-ACP methyl ester carboxylesterase
MSLSSKLSAVLTLGLTGLAALQPRAAHAAADAVQYKSVKVGDLDIFYREAGPRDAPTVLLLHGFPTSSFMFRNLIPRLADRYHVIAPDYPGYGQSSFPSRDQFKYTFENLSKVIAGFTDALGLKRYALYIQDYGSPIGLRLAFAHPERVTALIVQNGNAYEEGLSDEWAPLRELWKSPTPANREQVRHFLTAEGTRQQYVGSVPPAQVPAVSPDTWTLDWSLMQRPGNIDVQLDLFGDYGSNVALYPKFHEYFRTYQPATLIVWGRHDPFFTVAGAEAYKRDIPKAELHLLDAGHFALETEGAAIASYIRAFLAKQSAYKVARNQ